jgi:hypothetical protein
MQAIPFVERVDETPQPAGDSTLGLAELLLKDPVRVDRMTRDEGRLTELVPRFLALALASFSIYSAAMVAVLHFVPAPALPEIVSDHWRGGGGVAVSLAFGAAYALGMIAASGVCLPSFYFFGLLAGLRFSFLQTVAHVVKGMGATAVVLVGLLPIYFAVVLGLKVFEASETWQLNCVCLGLALPFVAGLWGVRSIYRGFFALVDTIPEEQRYSRAVFLRRLTLAWATVYTAVTPIMIWTLWNTITELPVIRR